MFRLLDSPVADIAHYCELHGQKRFRAQQIIRWVFKRLENDPSRMTDIALPFREHLVREVDWSFPEVIWDKTSEDGTRKWLLKLSDGNAIETVYIPETGRGTLCVSSQVGCGLNCSFCATARQGFNRHLTQSEILGQVWQAQRILQQDTGLQHPITNVVFMGMGEPLLNTSAVFGAVEILLHDWAFGLSKNRVTISTSGVVPGIYALTEQCDAALAISLHAPNDALRNQLVPLNKKYPIAVLLEACAAYLRADSRRHILFEYVMLHSVNDSLEHARQLSALFRKSAFADPRKIKLNLIPFNPFPHSGYETSSPEAIAAFQTYLKAQGWITTVRKTRGQDKGAACGQLVGNFTDRTSRSRLMRQRQAALTGGDMPHAN